MVAGALVASSAATASAQDFLGSGGNVSVKFFGYNADDISTLAYKIGGTYNDGGSYFNLFTNGVGGSAVGSEMTLGTVAAGTPIFFRLTNSTVPNVFYSGAAARNPDNFVHVQVTAGSGTASIYGGTYSTRFNFEDRFNPPSDLDYNDLFFEIANVSTTTVPEPSTYALMAAGLVGLAVARRRRSA